MHVLTRTALLALPLLLNCGCDRPADGTVAAAAPVAPVKIERSPARLELRARERWELVARADWISAYEFLTGEQRLRLPLPQYLEGKENHKYASPSIERILGEQGALGFVAVRVFWTPDHPAMKGLPADQRGSALTQDLPMIETWRWDGDDWYFVQAQSVEDFASEHKDLAAVQR